ncbi:MAG: AAA family ATPase [Dehalococcoidia bacterium]
MIKNIGIRNFKSFDVLSVDLGPLCVLVGPNAGGKTNFVDALRFIQECVRQDVSIAVNHRFGWRGVRCRRRYKHTAAFHLDVEPVDPELSLFVEFLPSEPGEEELFRATSFSYDFRFVHRDGVFDVAAEEFTAKLQSRRKDKVTERESSFLRRGLEVTLQPPRFLKEPLQIPRERSDTLFLASPLPSSAAARLGNYISRWAFFDIDPAQARAPRLAENVVGLAEHGENLPLVLDLLGDKQDSESFALGERIEELMCSMVPGFKTWKTEQTYDGRIGFRIRESGIRSPFPPELISDGTIFLLGLLTALLGQRRPASAIFIEEPERGLHPQIMEGLVDLMRQVSTRTQVVVTTHSPDLVRHLRPHEVYMVDKVDRATKIIRASSVEQVEQFLEHFTIDELWLQGYLQGGLPI